MAQGTLASAGWKGWAWALKPRLVELLSIVQDPSAPYEARCGATFVLGHGRAMAKLCHDPALCAPLARALARPLEAGLLRADDQAKLEALLLHLATKYAHSWVPMGSAGAGAAAGLQSHLLDLVRPEGPGPGPGPGVRLGWRHELVAGWLLLSLCQPDTPPPPGAWAYFSGHCLRAGDGLPLQVGFYLALFSSPLLSLTPLPPSPHILNILVLFGSLF